MIDNPTVSIICPYFNRWDLTHQRLMELYRLAPDYCEIILVDDASTELECGNGLNWWMKNINRHNIRYYKNKENVGFGASLNNGAKLSKGKYIIFLSNDVMIHGDFITDIVELINTDDKMLVAGRVVDWAGGWNEFDISGKHYVIPYAEGWLLGCTKKAWKELGGFDPIYSPYDYEDMDLTVNALDMGYNIVNLNSTKVKHIGGATIYNLNPSRVEITNRNRILFFEKWKDKIPSLVSL